MGLRAELLLNSRRVCTCLGDSKVDEDSHQRIRDTVEEGRHHQSSVVSKQNILLGSSVLTGRDLKGPVVSDDDIASTTVSVQERLHFLSRCFNTKKHKLNEEFQNMIDPSLRHPRPAPKSMIQEVACTETFFAWHSLEPKPCINHAIASSFAEAAAGTSTILKSPSGQLLWVLVACKFAFVAAQVKLRQLENGIDFFEVLLTRASWIHIFDDLPKWMAFPVIPKALHFSGPIGFLATGPAECLVSLYLLSGKFSKWEKTSANHCHHMRYFVCCSYDKKATPWQNVF